MHDAAAQNDLLRGQDHDVVHQGQLFPMIREKVREMIGGYLNTPELADLDNYIVPASLHDDQGIMGCIKLGLDALC